MPSLLKPCFKERKLKICTQHLQVHLRNLEQLGKEGSVCPSIENNALRHFHNVTPSSESPSLPRSVAEAGICGIYGELRKSQMHTFQGGWVCSSGQTSSNGTPSGRPPSAPGWQRQRALSVLVSEEGEDKPSIECGETCAKHTYSLILCTIDSSDSP